VEPTPTLSVPSAEGLVAVNGTLAGGSLAISISPAKVRIPLERETTNTADVSVTITASAPWVLSLRDSKPTDTGYMTGLDIPSRRLANSMRAAFGAAQIDLRTGGMLTSGAGDAKVSTQLRQLVVASDLPGDYEIQVLFEAVAGF
jgi:hypothetical protein